MTLAGVLSLSPQWSDADASWLLLGVFQHNEGARVSLGSSPFPVLRDPTKATKGGCATSSSSFGLQTGRSLSVSRSFRPGVGIPFSPPDDFGCVPLSSIRRRNRPIGHIFLFLTFLLARGGQLARAARSCQRRADPGWL